MELNIHMFKEPESEFIDYKEFWHSNNVKLLHDILSLANADSDNDRYLVFGVSDDQTRFPGVGKDPNRKRQQDIVECKPVTGDTHCRT